ncbi:MAG: hypothetical protein V4760_11130 [Bdellovibrionota bacterium]
MIREMWGSFPRLIEQNINGLLDRAEPNPQKAFMLYKTCQHEGAWEKDFRTFAHALEEFFAKPRAQRRKSDFDRHLPRPLDHSAYQAFHLNFRTAYVPDKEIEDLASWAHNLMKHGKKTESAVISLDVMIQTLRYITNPPPYEKAEQIEFEDFCRAWKKTVFQSFGARYDAEFDEILGELRTIDSELREQVTNPGFTTSFPTLFLSEKEIEWVSAVREAAETLTTLPDYPSPQGPQKQVLLDLQRVIRLYGISYGTRLPELMRHRESVRMTILDRCAKLLDVYGDSEAA